jgi:hypothetical protein
VYIPAVVALHVRVEVPEVVVVVRLWLEGVIVHESPEELVTVSVTVPVKPLTPLTMMEVDPLSVPVGGVTVDGLATTVKSTTFTVTVAVRDGKLGEEPVTVTT